MEKTEKDTAFYYKRASQWFAFSAVTSALSYLLTRSASTLIIAGGTACLAYTFYRLLKAEEES